MMINTKFNEYFVVTGAKTGLSQLKGYDSRRTFVSGQWNHFLHDCGCSSSVSRIALFIVWWDWDLILRPFIAVVSLLFPLSCLYFFLMSFPLLSQALEERVVRSTSPSILSATVGQRLLSRLDDGSGCTSPEKVIALWTEEGIHNSRDVLQVSTFDFTAFLSTSYKCLR